MLRDQSALHGGQQLAKELWAVVGQVADLPAAPAGQRPAPRQAERRFRALVALAGFDPKSPRWKEAGRDVVGPLLAAEPLHAAVWSAGLRDVKESLLAPLSEVYRDRERPAERRLATFILSDYVGDYPQRLAELLMDADEQQFAVLFPKLQAHGESGLPVLTGEVDKKLPADAKEDDKEQLAKRQANAAVAMLRMNQPMKVWPLLKHRPDPRVRSYLIHRFGPLGAEVGALVKRLAEEPDVSIRRALLLSLGPEEFGKEAWTPEGKRRLVQQVQEMYRTVDDPGLHAAAEWLLRQWKEEAWLRQTNEAGAKDKPQREKWLEGIRQELAKTASRERKRPEGRHWYVNGQGQTMVVIPGPVEFVMGSPPTEEGRGGVESQHRKRIGRTFALAATSVTKEQFLRFLPKFGHTEMKRYPDPTCPIGGVVWYEAAAYCNWLSKQEGIPEDQWCYETNPRGQVTKLKEKYLSRTGYRLPTEAEWEYACRAGAATSRYYGESAELLGKYSWYFQNAGERTWPVGSKKPNDLGLFDLHGNVYSWCQERYKEYPQGAQVEDDIEDILSIDTQEGRVLRGGSFLSPASFLRSANRYMLVPAYRYIYVGLCPARTFR
ncbi:MAG: formylglycine-generating enzyme family protein [Planctomycetes bacterium]|nr:formylglycine-generating enzyme family protein [Planctomycetota bacterium]